MLCLRRSFAAGALLTLGVSSFMPFADIEDLNPRSMDHFCDPEVKTGVRLCQGETNHELEDGGLVGLKWAMNVDPDRVLSVDLEHKHGVRILKCTQSSLEMILPPDYAGHARRGDVIVASHFVHGCEHLMKVPDKDHPELEPVPLNMYHRIVKVHRLEWRNPDGASLAAGSPSGKSAHVRLWTKELPTLAHAVHNVAYDFHYTPPEAVDKVPYPKRRTWDEDYYKGRWVEKPSAPTEETSKRRLQFWNHQDKYNGKGPDPSRFKRPSDSAYGYNPLSDVNYKLDGGHPTFGGSIKESDDVKSLMNYKPKKVANFAWNWDFKLGASQDISFNYTIPGSKMFVMIKRPSVKTHSLIRMRFRSYMPNQNAHDSFFSDEKWIAIRKHRSDNAASVFDHWEPRVKWEASIEGHGHFQGKLMAQMKSVMGMETNPLKLIQIPVLQKWWEPHWFGTLNFNIGKFPIALTPGVQFKAKFFHYGTFKGGIALGIKTHAEYFPKIQFDSFTGLRVNLQVKAKDTTLTPPNWLVSTRHFECGIALEPTIWIKGNIGQQITDTKFAVALRPYFNMTITRAGNVHVPGEETRELIIYPFRVVGITQNGNDFNKRYKVVVKTFLSSIDCSNNPQQSNNHNRGYQSDYDENGNYRPDHENDYGDEEDKPRCADFDKTAATTEELNFGEIEYHDPVGAFSFGFISQSLLLRLNIQLKITQYDHSDPNNPSISSESPWTSVQCRQVVNGVCDPNPMIGKLNNWLGNPDIKIFAHAVWQVAPRPWFATRLRGVSTSFPEVIVNKDYIARSDSGYNIDSYVNEGLVTGSGVNKPLVLVLVHDARKYPVILNKHKGYVPGINSSSLTCDDVLELGATFLSTWEQTCQTGTANCDPRLDLYHGDKLLATAKIPAIPWQDRQRMSGTLVAIKGSEAGSSREVPVSVGLKPTNNWQANWGHVGLVRMKFSISNPAAWSRFISPYTFTPVAAGSTYSLVWTLNNTDPTVATTFTLQMMKRGADTGKSSNPGVGNMDFTPDGAAQAISIKPTFTNQNVMAASASRFTYPMPIVGLAAGDVAVVSLQWTDEYGMKHKMLSPPLLVQGARRRLESEDKEAPEAKVEQDLRSVAELPEQPTVETVETEEGYHVETQDSSRRLSMPWDDWFNGGKPRTDDDTPDWNQYGPLGDDDDSDQNWHGNHKCRRKDLNFAFGAGIMFRAYVDHLSLPADLPILGSIQSAPQLGMPWQNIIGWSSSNFNLAKKLPSLLCRHGVCSAVLPGCPEFNHKRSFYPEVTIRFKKTFRYPDGPDREDWVKPLREALSYVFAVTPEFVNIILHYTNSTGQGHSQQWTSAEVPHPVGGLAAPAPALASTAPVAPAAPVSAPIVTTVATPAPALAPTPAAPASAPASAPVPAVTAAPTPAPVPAELPATAAPTIASGSTLAPGPIIKPLGEDRRLSDSDIESGVHQVTISFKQGLPYTVDNLLVDEMRKQGMFEDVEALPSGRIHSYTIRDLGSKLNEKYSENGRVWAPQSNYFALCGFAACALVGIAVGVSLRRARSRSYQPVEDPNQLLESGPVE